MPQKTSLVRATYLFAMALLFFSPSLRAELTDARFRELLKELKPDEQEPWRTVPWKTALIDAQEIAAKQNKPIFIWAMDGHPLGCT